MPLLLLRGRALGNCHLPWNQNSVHEYVMQIIKKLSSPKKYEMKCMNFDFLGHVEYIKLSNSSITIEGLVNIQTRCLQIDSVPKILNTIRANVLINDEGSQQCFSYKYATTRLSFAIIINSWEIFAP